MEMTMTTGVETPLEEHLKKWFGYNTFRAYQKEIIEGVLQNKDVLAILPTGAGKSLCYQLPALLMQGTAIVVSPLISLMQDQVNALIKNGIPAAYINSSVPGHELYELLRNLNHYKLLYIAPERFADPNFLERLKNLPLSFFVIDEAHCISQWGHSFRPDYRQLSLIKKNFPTKPLMALTATATVEVEKDISTQLVMKDPFIAKGSFDRPNLMIRINAKSDPYSQIKTFLKNYKDQSGIIYAATRKEVDSLYEHLKNEGYKLGKYHAGLSDHLRREALHDFIHDKTTLMIATVAFGMGINKPDVRFIIHHDMPRTVEQYYQEIGRAGRDGLPAECLMLFSVKELIIYKSFLDEFTDPLLRAKMESKTEAIYALCRSYKCRRVGLLKYFGENYSSPECNGCDNCVDDEEKIDATVIVQKILSCVYRLKEGFGVRYVIDVLRGSKNSQILSRGHDQLSTYNLMPECTEGELRYYIDAMLMMGILKKSEGEYPVLQWTDLSRTAVKDEKKIEFRKKVFKEKAKDSTSLPYNHSLFRILSQLRLEYARKEEVPPYAVFSDKSLIEMSTYYPQTDIALISLNGVGRYKLDKYGEPFLKAIIEFCEKNNITSSMPNPAVRKARSSTLFMNDSSQESFKLFMRGHSVEEIANERELSMGTIISHISKCIETCDKEVNIDSIVSKERQIVISKAIDEVGDEKLNPIKQKLPEEYTYDEIRLVVSTRKAKRSLAAKL